VVVHDVSTAQGTLLGVFINIIATLGASNDFTFPVILDIIVIIIWKVNHPTIPRHLQIAERSIRKQDPLN
jgi:hypothetical protein